MESRQGKGGKPSLENRLAKNFRELGNKVITVTAGVDNLTKQLHPARFLPGALCSVTDLWLEANKHLVDNKLNPYAHYDLQGLGVTHILTAKTWEILHDPGSPEISIKLFFQAQATSSDDNSYLTAQAEGLDAFKMALSVARVAQQLIMPWNLSITALQFFLESTKFGFKFFSSQKEHVTKLTDFADLVLKANARNWQLGKPFLGAVELAQYWAMFTAGCSASNNRSQPFFNNKKRGRSPSPKKDSKSDRPWFKPKNGDFCIRFNEGRCMRPDNACTYRGIKLLHKCSHKSSSGRTCGRDHPSKYHK
jgi:hypothetical protein